MSLSLSQTIKEIIQDIFGLKNDKIQASRIEGVLPIETIPPAAIERIIIVNDDPARFSLTKAQVQNGDTVKVNSTNKMYFVKDDTKLNLEAGYEIYTAGKAAEAFLADQAKAIKGNKLIFENGTQLWIE